MRTSAKNVEMLFKSMNSKILIAVISVLVGFLSSNLIKVSSLFDGDVDFSEITGVEIEQEGYDWLRSARALSFGEYVLFSGSDKSKGSGGLAYYPNQLVPYPSVVVSSSDEKGMKSITITDAEGRSLSVAYLSADGLFTEYDFTDTQNGEKISFIDSNLDGEFNRKFVWEPTPSIYVKHGVEWLQWTGEGLRAVE